MTLLDRLCSGFPDGTPSLRAAFVTAHPDDEAIGAGIRLHALAASASLICLTDGSPRDLQDARAAGCPSREEYARVRRSELGSALVVAGIGPERCLQLNIVDRETAYQLSDIVRELVKAFSENPPDIILTHPYEGGHPDHDSAAFAVAAAAAVLRKSGTNVAVAEFASYNSGPAGDGWSTDFLPDPDSPVRTLELSVEERKMKRRMMECHVSQKWILDAFPGHLERFRPAPEYDFGRAPHPGRLFYERQRWEIDGARWRALASSAAAALGMP